MKLYNFIKKIILTVLLFFASLNSVSQSFETYYKQAKDDFKNELFKSNSFDNALNTCPDITEYPELLIYKAISLEFKGDIILSIKYIKLALKFITEDEDLYEAHSFLGTTYTFSNDLEKSGYHYAKAVEFGERLNNKMYVFENKFNLLANEFDLAKDKSVSLNKMLEFYNTMPDEFGVGTKLTYFTVLVELSEGILLLDDYKTLKNELKTSLNIDTLTNDFKGQYYNSNAILETYSKNYEQALKYSDSSYQISKKQLYKDNLLNDFYTYKLIYEKLNKPEKALMYADSILELEGKFDEKKLSQVIDSKEENLLFNKIDKEINTNESSSFLMLIVIGILLLTVSIYFFFFRKKEKQLRQNYNYYFEKKYNKLWSDHQLSIKQLEDIRILIKNNNSNYSKELKFMFNNLNIHLENTKGSHHNHLNILKNNFIKSLEKEAPYLNETEQLVCYYIALEFSHKKIAELLNKTEKSIDSYKYRINSKVRKHHNVTLDEFFKILKINDLESELILE